MTNKLEKIIATAKTMTNKSEKIILKSMAKE